MGSKNQRRTTEQAIQESKTLHGDLYEYDKFEYLTAKLNVTLFCKTHQEYFNVLAGSHFDKNKRSGCPKCSIQRRADGCRSYTQEFIRKAKEKQSPTGRNFDYSRVDYKNARDKVEIGCLACGAWFMQSPYVHLYAKGCGNCRDIELARTRSHTKEQFVAAAIKVAGDKYSYELVQYKNARTYVDIVCNDCGTIFKKKPTEILNGLGCKCHTDLFGYRPEDKGNLYILSSRTLTKVGITNGDPKYRAKVISKSYGENFTVVAYYPMDGKHCTDIETELLRDLREQYKSPEEKFDGYTECFYGVDHSFIYQRVDHYIRSFNGS